MQKNLINFFKILLLSFKKSLYDPYNLSISILLKFLLASVCSLTTIYYYITDIDHVSFYIWTTSIIWVSIFTLNATDAVIVSTYYNQFLQTPKSQSSSFTKLKKLTNFNNFSLIQSAEIKPNDIILLKAGDVVPLDGIVIWGKAFINEAELTGETKPVIKSTAFGENSLKKSSIVISDQIVIKINNDGERSVLSNIKKFINVINRDQSPLEMALQMVISTISILFIFIAIALFCIGGYIGLDLPMLYFIFLATDFVPATSSSLIQIISKFSIAKLSKRRIEIKKNFTLDSVLDVNIVVVDKTGTLTLGQRIANKFIQAPNVTLEELIHACYLCSVKDNTIEGSSIVSFIKQEFDFKEIDIDFHDYKEIVFSANNCISGCNYNGLELRKGSYSAICAYLGIEITDLPNELLEARRQIALECGTPMLVSKNNKILGVINLQDTIKENLKNQIELLKKRGILSIMLTGDNELTAKTIAKAVGLDAFYAELNKNQKLAFIKKLQGQGYTVAMIGDGENDAPAIAKADLGIAFANSNENAKDGANLIFRNKGLSDLIYMQAVAKSVLVKRGAVVIFSLTSDITKYILMTALMFSTNFFYLTQLNILNFHSFETTILASQIYNILVIFIVLPFIFNKNNFLLKIRYFWLKFLIYISFGIVIPVVSIKILDYLIFKIGII